MSKPRNRNQQKDSLRYVSPQGRSLIKGKRTDQVAELIRQEINNILVRDFEPPQGSLISVAEVTVAPDLKNATAYLSVLPENKTGTALEVMRKFTGHVQGKINNKLKMKIIPRIHWQIDERAKKYQAIDDALLEQ